MRIEGDGGRKTLVRFQFYFGRLNTVNNTPEERYVYVVHSVYKSCYSRVVEPARAKPRIPSKLPHFPQTSLTVEKLHPQLELRHSIFGIHLHAPPISSLVLSKQTIPVLRPIRLLSRIVSLVYFRTDLRPF